MTWKCIKCGRKIKMGDIIYPTDTGLHECVCECDPIVYSATMKPGGPVWDDDGKRCRL